MPGKIVIRKGYSCTHKHLENELSSIKSKMVELNTVWDRMEPYGHLWDRMGPYGHL